MRDVLQHVLARAVRPRQRDEGPPQIMLSPAPQADALQILMEALESVAVAAVAAPARWDDASALRKNDPLVLG